MSREKKAEVWTEALNYSSEAGAPNPVSTELGSIV